MGGPDQHVGLADNTIGGRFGISHTLPQAVCWDLTDSAIRGPDQRFPYCATGRPDQPFRHSIYSANRGPGATYFGLSDSAIGFRFVLYHVDFYKTVSLKLDLTNHKSKYY